MDQELIDFETAVEILTGSATKEAEHQAAAYLRRAAISGDCIVQGHKRGLSSPAPIPSTDWRALAIMPAGKFMPSAVAMPWDDDKQAYVMPQPGEQNEWTILKFDRKQVEGLARTVRPGQSKNS